MEYLLRIISGKYKNKALKSPRNSATHPMSDRARNAIFNMIGNVKGKNVLDLFAGTGALGLEALSRGAQSATFVENNTKTFLCLKENLDGIEDATVLKTDAYKIDNNEKYDIIFIDPPYEKFDSKVLEFKKLLTDSGIMIVSSPEPINQESRKYAGCYISLLYARD